MANRIEKLRELGLGVEVVKPAQMAELGFGALLGVAQGSVNEARMVIMRWNGGETGEKPLAFIGKGVTFDTGGISIKPAAGMEDMKWDMAGAAAVTGLMAALAGRKARGERRGPGRAWWKTCRAATRSGPATWCTAIPARPSRC